MNYLTDYSAKFVPIDKSGISYLDTSAFECVDFTLLLDNNKLTQHLEPWVTAAVQRFDTHIPVPPTYRQFETAEYFRLRQHRRSFCHNPNQKEHKNVICFRGYEVFAEDFTANIQALSLEGPAATGIKTLDHLINVERKIPGCLTWSEAFKEANITADLVKNYIEAYGELPQLPIPLKIIQLPEQIYISVKEAMGEILSGENLNEVSSLLKNDGLAGYTYLFPASVMRVGHIPNAQAEEHPRDRIGRISGLTGQAETVISSWTRLLARMLCLGYLPGTRRSPFTGIACDTNSATITGGFCGMSSVEKMSDIKSDQSKMESIDLVFHTFCKSVLFFLSASHRWNRSRHSLNYLKQWLYRSLCEEIRTSSRGTQEKTLAFYFNNNDSFSEMLEHYYLFY